MVNTEYMRVWVLQQRQNLVREACSYRLYHEASRDQKSLASRILGSIGAWMIRVGTRIGGQRWHLPEKPHAFVTPPQDRVYA